MTGRPGVIARADALRCRGVTLALAVLAWLTLGALGGSPMPGRSGHDAANGCLAIRN